MLRFVGRKISRRIAVILFLAMAAFGIGGIILAGEHNSKTEREISRRLLTTLAHAVATSFRNFDARLGQHPVEDIVADLDDVMKLNDQRGLERLDVFNNHGRVRWSTDARRRGAMMPADVTEILTSTGAIGTPDVAGPDEVAVFFPLRRSSGCLPCHSKSPDPIGGVYLLASRDQALSGLQTFGWRAGLAVAIFVSVLTALLYLMLNRVVVVRLGKLLGVVSKAEEGDFLVRADVRSEDEIGHLASAFNKLLAKITDLRVENIDAEREMSEVRDELSLKRELQRKSELLEAANERLNARVRQLAFLNKLASDLASKLDLDYMLDRFCARVLDDLKVPEFAVLIFDQARGKIRVIKARGFDGEDKVEGKPFDLADGISGEAATKKQPIYVPNLETDGRRLAYRSGAAPSGSLFCVPVVYHDRVIGLLNFSSPLIDAFREEERELFATIAHQAALTLANAQLFQKTLELSQTDGLTGVLNRRAMEERLDLEWSRAQRDGANLSMVMIDIDHFKVYNDQHGHQLGDETLRRVAHILERNVRKVDAVARYGGEEFAVILPRASKHEAVEVARKLRRSVEQSDFVRGYLQPLGRVTISCGVASSPEDAESLDDLIHMADDALFAAKEEGRNKVVAYSQTEGVPTMSPEPETPAPSEPQDELPARPNIRIVKSDS